MSSSIKIDASWKTPLKAAFEAPSFGPLTDFVRNAYQEGTVYPPAGLIFNAFDHCPFDQVNVVILGQDPYHGPQQAHGLCFSVQKGTSVPPSLKNIFKELEDDLGVKAPAHGDLTHWADQGVLLLNATLTVSAGAAGSHQGKGWEAFTDAVIQTISQQKEHVVFVLWGRYAQNKASLIDESKHLILRAAHPSPLSAYNGFFGSKPFSQTNAYLTWHNKKPIDWSL